MIRSNRARTAFFAALLSATPLTFTSCASLMPPIGTSWESQRGFKARTYVGTPEDLHPIVVRTLTDLGFEVRSNVNEPNYLTGNRGMATSTPSADGGNRNWTRVGVRVQQVDMHRRAPRTLVEIDAEKMQGRADGPIEASVGTVPGSFYEGFFQTLDGRFVEMTRQPVRGLLPPS